MPGRPGCGHGDRPVPPGFAGVSAWQPAFVACASSAGSGDCSICGPGNNAGRSRRSGDSRSPGKTVGAVALHGSPWRRFRRAGTTAPQHGKRGLIYGGWSVRFFGPAQKARSGADGRGFPIPAPAYQSRSADDGSIWHYRRSLKNAAIEDWSPLSAFSLPWRLNTALFCLGRREKKAMARKRSAAGFPRVKLSPSRPCP